MSIFKRTIKLKHLGEISKSTFKKNPNMIINFYINEINIIDQQIRDYEEEIKIIEQNTKIKINTEVVYSKLSYSEKGQLGILCSDNVYGKTTFVNALDVLDLYISMEIEIEKIKDLQKKIEDLKNKKQSIDGEYTNSLREYYKKLGILYEK